MAKSFCSIFHTDTRTTRRNGPLLASWVSFNFKKSKRKSNFNCKYSLLPTGMRGKKDYLDPEVFNYLTNDDDQKLYQALLNNNLLNRLYDSQVSDSTTDRVGELADMAVDEKRTSSSNFDLMEAINDIDQTLAYEKRAPYGFVGMRGKRAPSGFMGEFL